MPWPIPDLPRVEAGLNAFADFTLTASNVNEAISLRFEAQACALGICDGFDVTIDLNSATNDPPSNNFTPPANYNVDRISPATAAIDENATGTVVDLTANTIDPGYTGSFSWRLPADFDIDSGYALNEDYVLSAFSVHSGNGVVSVNGGVDYETLRSSVMALNTYLASLGVAVPASGANEVAVPLYVEVQANGAAGAYYWGDIVWITVHDVNEVPTDFTLEGTRTTTNTNYTDWHDTGLNVRVHDPDLYHATFGQNAMAAWVRAGSASGAAVRLVNDGSRDVWSIEIQGDYSGGGDLFYTVSGGGRTENTWAIWF